MQATRLRTMIAVTIAAVLASASLARAEALTFQMTVGDVLASVGRTNAFLVSIGRQARGLKLVPGGTRFAGLTCAGFGDVYKLAGITVLDGPGAFSTLVTTKRGRDALTLAKAFTHAGATAWVPPATDAESDRQLWTATPILHGLRFTSDALVNGGDGGLLDASQSAGMFRFRANVPPHPIPGGSYRFLLELVGQTASSDAGLVAFGQQRCITFVDLVPVDVSVLKRLIDETVTEAHVRNGLSIRMPTLETALERRDFRTALDVMAYLIGHLTARTPDEAPPAVTRRVVKGVFDVRRGLDFRPAFSACGNGTRETGEACDGADLGGFTCSTVGYASGALTCEPSCLFNYDQCVANPVCGNGVLEINEECDNGPLNSDSEPDACRANCKRSFCGDGVIDTFEDCEGSNLAGETCSSLGYSGGSLRCYKDWCEYDDERCDDDF